MLYLNKEHLEELQHLNPLLTENNTLHLHSILLC